MKNAEKISNQAWARIWGELRDRKLLPNVSISWKGKLQNHSILIQIWVQAPTLPRNKSDIFPLRDVLGMVFFATKILTLQENIIEFQVLHPSRISIPNPRAANAEAKHAATALIMLPASKGGKGRGWSLRFGREIFDFKRNLVRCDGL